MAFDHAHPNLGYYRLIIRRYLHRWKSRTELEEIALQIAMQRAKDALFLRGYWPRTPRDYISFTDGYHGREDLAELVLRKHHDEIMLEAQTIYQRRKEKSK